MIEQNAREKISVLCITIALILGLSFYDQPYYVNFNFWSFFFCLISCTSYAHFFVKEEYLLKRRQISVFELLDAQGKRVFTLYLIAILITSIIQWCSGEDWIAGIYAKAVFSNGLNMFLTAMMPVAAGLSQVILLTLLFNSSSVRFCTILMLPASIALLCFTPGEDGWVIAATVLLAIGVFGYNASANCGKEMIDEYRNEVRQRKDQIEEVYFKAEAIVVVDQEQMMMQQ